MDYLLGGALGGLVAFVFAIPAIVIEFIEHGKVKNPPLLVDIKIMWGKKIKKTEAFLIGLLVNILIGFLFGFIYPLFVSWDWLFVTHDPYSLLSLFIYAIGSWVVVGTIIFPLLGFGLFGKKEGRDVWLELLVSILLVGIGMWVLVQLYQPMYFV